MNNYQFGIQQERMNQKKIEKDLNMKIVQSTYRYERFDFSNKERNVFVELKTRRYQGVRYNSNMLSYSKFKYLLSLAEEEEASVYLYYIVNGSLFKYPFHKNSRDDLVRRMFRGTEHLVKLTSKNQDGVAFGENILIKSSAFSLVE